jgi:hypothetical protein
VCAAGRFEWEFGLSAVEESVAVYTALVRRWPAYFAVPTALLATKADLLDGLGFAGEAEQIRLSLTESTSW